jgi:hypothetical protein
MSTASGLTSPKMKRSIANAAPHVARDGYVKVSEEYLASHAHSGQ